MNGWIGCALALLLAAGAHADTVVLEPVRDNTLFESATGSLSNGAGPAVFVGMNGSERIRRGVMAFDLVGHVPPGAILVHAELRLTLSNAPNEIPRTVSVHRALADWGEGGSSSSGGGGAPAEPGDATWLHRFFPDSPWSTAGGDFDPTPLAATVVNQPAVYVWSDPSLTDDVRRWLDDPTSNFGWMLIGGEIDPSSARRFDSREAPDSGTRPALYVEFTQAVPSEATTWTGVKSRYAP